MGLEPSSVTEGDGKVVDRQSSISKLEEYKRELEGEEKELYVKTLMSALNIGTRAQLGVDGMVDKIISLLEFYRTEHSASLFEPLSVSVKDSGFPSYLTLLNLLSLKMESVKELRRNNVDLASHLISESKEIGDYLTKEETGTLAERVSRERAMGLDLTATSIREAIASASDSDSKDVHKIFSGYAEAVRLARFYQELCDTDILIDKDAQRAMEASLAGKRVPISLYEGRGSFKEESKHYTLAETVVGGYLTSPGIFVQSTILAYFNPRKRKKFFMDERCQTLTPSFQAELESHLATFSPKVVFNQLDTNNDVVPHSLRKITLGPFYTPYSVYSDSLPEGARLLLEQESDDPLPYILRIEEVFITRPMVDVDIEFKGGLKKLLGNNTKPELPPAREDSKYYYVVSPGLYDAFAELIRSTRQERLKQRRSNPEILIPETYICNARGGKFERCS